MAGIWSGCARWWSTSARSVSIADPLLAKQGRGEVDPLEHERAQVVHHRQRLIVHPHLADPQRVLEDGVDHLADPDPSRLAEARHDGGREGVGVQHAGSNGVERVVGQVGDPVRVADAEGLLGRGRRLDLPGVGADPVAHLPGQVEVLEHLVDPDALGGAGVSKAASIEETTVEDFDDLFAVNVRAPYFLVQQLLPVCARAAAWCCCRRLQRMRWSASCRVCIDERRSRYPRQAFRIGAW